MDEDAGYKTARLVRQGSVEARKNPKSSWKPHIRHHRTQLIPATPLPLEEWKIDTFPPARRLQIKPVHPSQLTSRDPTWGGHLAVVYHTVIIRPQNRIRAQG